MWADEISIPHFQHLVFIIVCVCDWWPGWSGEMRCLGSGLPAVKLSRTTTPSSASEETVGVWDCKHTDEWRLVDHLNFLVTSTDLFVPNHRQASARVFKYLQQLCMELNTAKNIFFLCIFGHFPVIISKQKLSLSDVKKKYTCSQNVNNYDFLFLNEDFTWSFYVLCIIKVCCNAVWHFINNSIQS